MPGPISGGTSGISASSVDTLTYKTIDANSNTLLNLNVTSVKDGSDPTKIEVFDVSGVSTATTRTLKFPDANTTIPVASQVLTFSGPTAARTLTLPDASFTVARTDAANTFTGHQTIEGVTSTGATGTGKFVFDTGPTVTVLTTSDTSSQSIISGGGIQLANTKAIRSADNNLTITFGDASGVFAFSQALNPLNDTGGALGQANRRWTNLFLSGVITTYNGVTTQGAGVVAICRVGRVTAQSAANSSIATYTTPASDGSYEVSMNMNVTAATALSTSLNCTYTDESNTSRTMILPITSLAGSFLTGGLATATGAFETPVMHIRCKASTAITLLTSAGTFTGVTYTAEGIIKQMQ